MSKGIFVCVNDAWKQCNGAFVNVDGVWKNLQKTHIRANDVWKEIAISLEPFAATGGAITDVTIGDTSYRTHKFIIDGTTTTFDFTVTGESKQLEVLLVGGGGSGGSGACGNPTSSPENTGCGGGGGGGGIVQSTFVATAQKYTITVGAGGAAITTQNTQGQDGNASTIADVQGVTLFSASGGGGGGKAVRGIGNSTTNGGGGGGGGHLYTGSVFGAGGTSSNGYSGSAGYMGGGGGGGKGGAGGKPTGGIGTAITFDTTALITYSTGGNGAKSNSINARASSGTNDLGNGGGGGNQYPAVESYSSGKGGNGVVIIRYPI